LNERLVPQPQRLSLVVPIISLLATLAFGFFLVRFLEGVAMKNLLDENENVIEAMSEGIQNEIRFSRSSVSIMSDSPWVLPLLLDPNPENLERAHSVLDRYNAGLGFSVCYLMNVQGITIASSNRNAPDSFMGVDYAFRPYFKEALQGRPSFYIASGVTSRERGFYASYPVNDKQGKIAGVAVIKKNIEAAKNILRGYPESFFISPKGIIFLSGSKDMVFRPLWPLAEGHIRELKDSKQFEYISAEAVFPERIWDGKKVKYRGESYRVFQKTLGPKGWALVLLAPLKKASFLVFFGWAVTAFMMALILLLSFWTISRLKDRGLLKVSEARYRGLFENSRDAIMILAPPSWKFVSGNLATVEMFRVKDEDEFISFWPWDLSPERQSDGGDSAEKAKAMIDLAVAEGFCFFSWMHKRTNGEEFPASVLLTRIGSGSEMIILATVRDISHEKKMELALKQKIEELERFNKFAVGRELQMVELKAQLKALQEKNGREG